MAVSLFSFIFIFTNQWRYREFWHSHQKSFLANMIINSSVSLKNLMQSFELVVTFYEIHKTNHNMHLFCGWMCIIAGSGKSLQLIGGIQCFSSIFREFTIQSWTRNAMRCNNRDDLLQLSFTLKISIFSKAYV